MFQTITAELMQYAKALVPLAVGFLLSLLSYVGILASMTVEEALYVLLYSVLTALGVYQMKNVPK